MSQGVRCTDSCASSIAVDGCAPNDCPDRILVAYGVTELLDQNGIDGFATSIAISRRIKCMALASRRYNTRFCLGYRASWGDDQIRSSNNGCVTRTLTK